MIVEFIGASGSGKTSLVRNVTRQLAWTDEVVTAWDLALGRLHGRTVGAPTTRNLVADLRAAGEVLRFNQEQRTFLAFALRRLLRHRPKRLQTLNYVRSVVRRLGMDAIARRRGRDLLVLADEGILLAAYPLFVYGNAGFDTDDLAEFAEVAPLPDLVVHVKAPIESLVRRTLHRPDPPRELRSRDEETIKRLLDLAVEMFAGLVTTSPLRGRVLEVENPGGSISEQQELATRVADWIRAPSRPLAGSSMHRAAANLGKEA